MTNLTQPKCIFNPLQHSLAKQSTQNVDAIEWDDHRYPHQLKSVATAPQTLFTKGTFEHHTNRIAVIGTRKPTSASLALTLALVGRLAEEGFSIVSGLALGIDAKAHQGTLQAGGHTIAVLPCGIEDVYPSRHKQLAEQILDSGGALISQNTGRRKPKKWSFLSRNHVIAGMSDAVFFVEGALKSGSMHTARYTLLLGRPLYVPVWSRDDVGDLSEGARALVELKGPELARRLDAKGIFKELLTYQFEERAVAKLLPLDELSLLERKKSKE